VQALPRLSVSQPPTDPWSPDSGVGSETWRRASNMSDRESQQPSARNSRGLFTIDETESSRSLQALQEASVATTELVARTQGLASPAIARRHASVDFFSDRPKSEDVGDEICTCLAG
jgi:hypothetical protein